MARQPSPRPQGRGRSQGRDYAAEYARRLARGRAEGKTRQQARGHKPAEHIERREKETARGGLTTYQRGAVRALFRDQARRIRGADPDALAEQGLRWAQGTGWRAFERLRDETKDLSKLRRARVRVKRRPGRAPVIELDVRGRAANRARMEAFAARWGIPDWRWLFYK